ncbi:MAG TPA: ATP-binding protein [Candidatus Dormibacteraeota bacterium]|nr:ATP-binding protein [Candidatus Dormibacteraeota bacterium]
MEPTGARLPDLEIHLERQMRAQERQLAVARLAIVAASVVAVVLFRDQLSSFPWLLGLAVAVAIYTTAILLLVGHFPAREVGIVATALDMVVVTLVIYVEPDALDAYLFYWPVVLGVALRFGLGASVWASLVVSFMYASVVLLATSEGATVRDLLPIRLGYLIGIGLAAGLFARVVIARAAENARLLQRLEEDERERARARETELLSQMARAFGSSLDRQATVDAIVHAAAPLLGDVTWLLVAEAGDDGSDSRLVMAGVDGRSGELVERLQTHLSARHLRIGEGIAGAAAATATPVVAGGDLPPPSHPGDPDGVAALQLRSILAVPIVSRGAVRGVLASASTLGRLLGERDARLAAAIAERAGPALENAALWADLQLQVAREQQAQRIKDDFLSIVSHELRTPLTSIQGYSQLLEARMRDSAAGTKAMSQLRVIRSQVARMRRLVDDLLDVSRIDRRGGVSIEPEPLDLAEEVREAAARTEREHPERQVTVELPGSLPIEADRDRIGQVLTNLLDNAVKYSPKGGPLVMRARSHRNGVELTIADSGVGIPAEQADHVFERFFQAEGDTSGRHFGGLGLGLYITRAIVEAHGGEIRAEPNREAGRGTLIRIQLPRRAVTRSQPPGDDEPPPFVIRRG